MNLKLVLVLLVNVAVVIGTADHMGSPDGSTIDTAAKHSMETRCV